MNDFESQWASISSLGHSAGRLRVYPDHLLDFYISFSLNGNREMVMEVPGVTNEFNDLPSFENLEVIVNVQSQGVSIGLMLIDHDLEKSFSVMCCDIAERSKLGETIEAAAAIAVECLRSWADLLKRRGKFGLSRNEVIGLWGELSTVQALLSSNLRNAYQIIQGWRGPNGDQRDIGYNNIRIEVKAQLSTKGVSLKISSLDQLDDRGNNLRVVLNRISPSENGDSVKNLAEKILSLLSTNRLAQLEFERKLLLADFDPLSERCNELFGLDERFVYEVRDDFPRLIPSNVHPGIKTANYEVSGEAIGKYQISWSQLEIALNE
jgi:hypothetical protein